MAVARTYEKFPLDGEPFTESGRLYVNIVTPAGKKKVRWYSDAERARMDKAAGVAHAEKDIMDFNARHAFGFDEDGYIYIYEGNPQEIEEWADAHHECVRRNLTFGIYTPSRLTIKDLPASITPVKLAWDIVKRDDTRMKPHDEVIRIIQSMTGMNAPKVATSSVSAFQGVPGGWIINDVTVRENTKKTTAYGDSHCHVLVDDDENVYVWNTSTRDFKVGTTIRLKMKVKEHKVIKGENVTVVWYCKESV